jgi:hypothetical protein
MIQKYLCALIGLIVLTLVFVSGVIAQSTKDANGSGKCDVQLDHAPSIRGLRLGHSIEDVKVVLPTLLQRNSGAVADPEIGLLQSEVRVDSAAYKPAFDGIDMVGLMFLDKKLAQIKIVYDHSIRWNKTRDFTSKISESLHLPNVWEGLFFSTGTLGDDPSMECGGFLLTAEIGLHTSPTVLLIKQSNLSEEVDRRVKQRDEKKRGSFKP